MSSVNDLLAQIDRNPESIAFEDVMKVINENYTYSATDFTCGEAANQAGTNEGSCKILAFGLKHQLSKEQTLALFGRFYRDDVLGKPEGTDHANIRNFMRVGWDGVNFDSEPLA